MDLLEDQLANPQPFDQTDLQGPAFQSRVGSDCRGTSDRWSGTRSPHGSSAQSRGRRSRSSPGCSSLRHVRQSGKCGEAGSSRSSIPRGTCRHDLEPVGAILRRGESTCQGRCVEPGVGGIDRGKAPGPPAFHTSNFASSLKSMAVDDQISEFEGLGGKGERGVGGWR